MTKFILHYSQMVCTLIMKTDFLSYSHAIIILGTRSISVYCWGWGGGGGGSLILGGYANRKSPSFRSLEAEDGYVISTVFLSFKCKPDCKTAKKPINCFKIHLSTCYFVLRDCALIFSKAVNNYTKFVDFFVFLNRYHGKATCCGQQLCPTYLQVQ